MEINPDVKAVLKEAGINKSEGLLCLLGIYFNLEVDKVCSEKTIKEVSASGIVERDYNLKVISWNMPLFTGEQTEFTWVRDWIAAFGKINPERSGSWRDAATRMMEFFRKYPEYRKEDVYRARDAYLRSVKDAQYVMHSHKFIFEGIGALKKSTLLSWCEKVNDKGNDDSGLKGYTRPRGEVMK